MEYTKNYKLPQWVETDRIMMEDFNQAMADIDAGISQVREDQQALEKNVSNNLGTITSDLGSIGKNARIVWGSYTGNGKYGSGNPTKLEVGFYPVLAFVGSRASAGNLGWPSVFIRDCTQSHAESSTDKITVSWSDTSLNWYESTYNSAQLQNNQSGTTYYYCVIGHDNA